MINFSAPGMSGFPTHPQYDILKKHVERSIQDIFFSSLKERSDDLIYIFDNVEQINAFINRMLKYWESIESYEICMEIKKLAEILRIKWLNRGPIEPGESSIKIKDIFKSSLSNGRSL
jgi:hypothetical protein